MENKNRSGIDLITEERKRQIEVEGWTKEHDNEYTKHELALAAICYALPYDLDLGDDETIVRGLMIKVRRERLWPWQLKWWKPNPNNRIRELVKAGALIAAEIDNLQNQ